MKFQYLQIRKVGHGLVFPIPSHLRDRWRLHPGQEFKIGGRVRDGRIVIVVVLREGGRWSK